MQIQTWKKWQLVLLEFPGKESLLFSLENTIWSLADVVLQYNPSYMQFIYVYLIKARVKGVKLYCNYAFCGDTVRDSEVITGILNTFRAFVQ